MSELRGFYNAGFMATVYPNDGSVEMRFKDNKRVDYIFWLDVDDAKALADAILRARELLLTPGEKPAT